MVGRVALLLIPAAIALAPVAHADDATFEEKLDSYGIVMADDATAISFAHAVCTDLENGTPYNYEVTEIYNMGQNFTQPQAGKFVLAAEAAYCPNA